MQIGIDYFEKGKPDSALTEIQKEKSPQNWQTYGLAIVFYGLGEK